jgi:hypothetical protein
MRKLRQSQVEELAHDDTASMWQSRISSMSFLALESVLKPPIPAGMANSIL